MPIYEYRCAECSFQEEYLQKVSEPPLTVCPSCGKESFRKLLSAAGFQLKGSGWYATDFRNSGSKSKAAETKSDKGASSESSSGSNASEKGGSDKGAADKGTAEKGSSDAGKSDKGGESKSGSTASTTA